MSLDEWIGYLRLHINDCEWAYLSKLDCVDLLKFLEELKKRRERESK